MGKTVTIRFAGDRPCRDCGSTTSQRGWISRTDEIVCANSEACAKRLKLAAVLKAEECDCSKGQRERHEVLSRAQAMGEIVHQRIEREVRRGACICPCHDTPRGPCRCSCSSRPKPWQDVRMLMRDYVYAVLEENQQSTILSEELRDAFKSALATLRKGTRKVQLADKEITR